MRNGPLLTPKDTRCVTLRLLISDAEDKAIKALATLRKQSTAEYIRGLVARDAEANGVKL